VPEWKWKKIAVDFVIGLPRTQSGYDSIWVIIDRMTKVAHFIPIKTTYSGPQLAKFYMSRIVCLHGVSKKIVSGRGTQFTSRFWERLHETLDTQLCFSSAYQPQTDGQTERVNQILEDMMRACALQYERSWDKSLSYAEFSYNNSYQESLKMALFQMVYGRRYQTSLFGMGLENKRFLDLTYCKKLRSKFVWLGRTFESRSLDKRAKSIIGGEN
jgi:transposase InsO family protein